MWVEEPSESAIALRQARREIARLWGIVRACKQSSGLSARTRASLAALDRSVLKITDDVTRMQLADYATAQERRQRAVAEREGNWDAKQTDIGIHLGRVFGGLNSHGTGEQPVSGRTRCSAA